MKNGEYGKNCGFNGKIGDDNGKISDHDGKILDIYNRLYEFKSAQSLRIAHFLVLCGWMR